MKMSKRVYSWLAATGCRGLCLGATQCDEVKERTGRGRTKNKGSPPKIVTQKPDAKTRAEVSELAAGGEWPVGELRQAQKT